MFSIEAIAYGARYLGGPMYDAISVLNSDEAWERFSQIVRHEHKKHSRHKSRAPYSDSYKMLRLNSLGRALDAGGFDVISDVFKKAISDLILAGANLTLLLSNQHAFWQLLAPTSYRLWYRSYAVSVVNNSSTYPFFVCSYEVQCGLFWDDDMEYRWTRDGYPLKNLGGVAKTLAVGVAIRALKGDLVAARRVTHRGSNGNLTDFQVVHEMPHVVTFFVDEMYDITSPGSVVIFVDARNREKRVPYIHESFGPATYVSADDRYYSVSHPRFAVDAPRFRAFYDTRHAVRSSARPDYHSRSSRSNRVLVNQIERARRSYIRMYGCEIEVEFHSEHLRNQWISRHNDEDISDRGTIYERDGSLSHDLGLEIITAPYSLSTIQSDSDSPVRAVFASLYDGIKRSSATGLHVNCSVAGADKSWLYPRISTLTRSLQPLFEVLARREDNSYARYSEVMGETSVSRYAAASDRGDRLELRIFAGAMSAKDVLEAVELADAMHVWCDHPAMPVANTRNQLLPLASMFRSWVRRNHANYPHLVARLGGADTQLNGFIVDPTFGEVSDGNSVTNYVWQKELLESTNNVYL